MPRYLTTSPDGRQFKVTAPEGATREEVIEHAQQHAQATPNRLQDFRQRYPEYNDMSDERLASALHSRFYSDIPMDEFRAQVGLGPRGAQTVSIPGVGDVEFPGSMSDADIEAAIRDNILPSQPSASPSEQRSGRPRYIAEFPDGARYVIEADNETQLRRAIRELGREHSGNAPGVGEQVGRQLGLTARHLVEGITAIPAALAQPVADLANKGLETVGADFRFPNQAQAVSGILSQAGVPEPETTGERIVGDASRVLASGGSVAGTAQRLPGVLAETLAMAPRSQAAGSVAAGTAMGTTREAGGGPVAQAVAGTLAGVAAPTSASLARQSLGNRAAGNVQTFRGAGVEPSVGNALNSPFLQGLENLLSRLPGGQGIATRFREQTQRQLGQQTRTGTTAETAGRTIERGITGPGGFLDRTKATYQRLDDVTASRIPRTSLWPADRTVATLDELTTPIPGAEKTTGALVNPTLAAMRNNLADDLTANSGRLPYEAMRQLRTRIGTMIDDSLVSGVPNGQLKRLYGALSQDMERAAHAAGAGPQFTRQNNFYRARMDRIESVLERVIGNRRQPEDIFRAINPTSPDAAGKLRATMRSLKPEERQVVSRAVVERLGRATPGRQNDVGDVFSSESFLTNWNRMSNAAKATLFPTASQRAEIDRIALIANRLRESGQVAANPSGTAGSAASYGIYGSPLVAMATGTMSPIVLGGSALALTNIGSRMLTSPKVVNWLARGATVRPGQIAPHIARLAAIYAEADDGLKRELEKFIGANRVPMQTASAPPAPTVRRGPPNQTSTGEYAN